MAEALDCANLSVTLTETINGTETGAITSSLVLDSSNGIRRAARIFFSLSLSEAPEHLRHHWRLAQNTLNRFT